MWRRKTVHVALEDSGYVALEDSFRAPSLRERPAPPSEPRRSKSRRDPMPDADAAITRRSWVLAVENSAARALVHNLARLPTRTTFAHSFTEMLICLPDRSCRPRT